MAKHITLQVLRAIKCIEKENFYYPYINQEAHILKNLRHPNIPIIFDIEEDDQYLYIIEEYIEGESLASYRYRQENLPETIILNFSTQICEIVHYLHVQQPPILYLDLKPENLIIAESKIVLVDFGTAGGKENLVRYKMGSKAYAAPEQHDARKLDERTDIYGIGKIMFFLIFGGNTGSLFDLETRKERYSKQLMRIIEKCLQKDPKQRYDSVMELWKELCNCNKHPLGKTLRSTREILTIAIAGTQQRIGVTHIALAMSSYLNHYIAATLYLEENERPILEQLLQQHKEIQMKNGIGKISQFEFALFSDIQEVAQRYQIQIKDYGLLKAENLDLYLQADVTYIVLGSKEWEIQQAKQWMKRCIRQQKICYLCNFTDTHHFQQWRSFMKEGKYYRVPYISDPFQQPCYDQLQEIIKDSVVSKRQIKTKGGAFAKKIHTFFKNI